MKCFSKTTDNFRSNSQVEFNNTLVKMAENDQNLVKELQNRLNTQRQKLQNKNKLFEAINKNVKILSEMSEHQKKQCDLMTR